MRMVLIVGGKAQGKGRLAAELAGISLSQALLPPGLGMLRPAAPKFPALEAAAPHNR